MTTFIRVINPSIGNGCGCQYTIAWEAHAAQSAPPNTNLVVEELKGDDGAAQWKADLPRIEGLVVPEPQVLRRRQQRPRGQPRPPVWA